MKILYVEDEADIREIAHFALEDEGFDIVFCESGVHAIKNAKKFQPDLILLDVMMPGMDGPTTLKKLRELPGFESIPVVFLTAKVQPKEVQNLYDLGAVDVIAKPFDPMTLANLIRSIVA